MEGYLPKYNGIYTGRDGKLADDEVCRLLCDLVSTESTFGHEEALGHLIEKTVQKEGIVTEIMPCTENRFNVILTLGASSYREKKLGLLLHGHYDTVPALDMENPYEPDVKNNKVRGRGAVDQKSGLAAAIAALIAVKRSGIKLSKPVSVSCVIDEESEHRGSFALSKSGMTADYAIVTEPTDMKTCDFGCLGTTPVRIRVKGKTAHASNPWKGINAIEKSLPVLERLKDMKFKELDMGVLGVRSGTLCVSKMEAGTAYNNVPGEAVIWLDRRTVPGENSALALQQIKDVIADAKKEEPDLSAEAEIARPDWGWVPIIQRGLNPTLTDRNCPLYDVIRKAAEKTGAEIPGKGFFWGYNDMDFLVNDMKIPTLVFGPGDGAMAHGPSEEVNIDQVCRCADIFALTIEEVCGSA